ncbi:hypothetical protein WJ978_09620 [Achromobacter xylosoxidans]
MRETMDCGVLLAPGHETAMGDWVARDQPRLARVRHLVHLRLPGSGPGGPDTHALAGLAVGLRRYDHCVLPVAPASLAWTRMSLQQARGTLATPILLLVHDMTAPAIEDLLRLGAADFIASPYCLESLRVRLGRLARRALAGRPGGRTRRDIRRRRATRRWRGRRPAAGASAGVATGAGGDALPAGPRSPGTLPAGQGARGRWFRIRLYPPGAVPQPGQRGARRAPPASIGGLSGR